MVDNKAKESRLLSVLLAYNPKSDSLTYIGLDAGIVEGKVGLREYISVERSKFKLEAGQSKLDFDCSGAYKLWGESLERRRGPSVISSNRYMQLSHVPKTQDGPLFLDEEDAGPAIIVVNSIGVLIKRRNPVRATLF